MQTEPSFQTLHQMFLTGKIDYQYNQYGWHECKVEKVNVENYGDKLELKIRGSDSIGPYSFSGQVIKQDDKFFLKCTKEYDSGSNVNYNGQYDHEKLGFFGEWYITYCGARDDFFMKFTLED